MALITAHFVELQFGIAIAATRIYFWILVGLLLALGMGWAQPRLFTASQAGGQIAPFCMLLTRHRDDGSVHLPDLRLPIHCVSRR